MTDIALSVPEAVIRAIARHVATIVTAEINTTTRTATPYMTVAEAAEYLRWSKDAIHKLKAACASPREKHESRILCLPRTSPLIWGFRAPPRPPAGD